MLGQVLRGEGSWIAQQPIVHLPVRPLVVGAAGGLGGAERLRVDVLERVVAEDIPDLAGVDVLRLEPGQHLGEVPSAQWALVIRELDDGQPGGALPFAPAPSTLTTTFSGAGAGASPIACRT